MGYGCKIPANQLGKRKKVWVTQESTAAWLPDMVSLGSANIACYPASARTRCPRSVHHLRR